MSALHGLHLNLRGWSARSMVACVLATVAFSLFSLFPVSRLDAQAARNDNAQHAPRFLLAMNGGRREPMDVSRVPVLRQRLALDLEGVTVKQAITAISRESGLVIWYSDDILRRNAPVRLRAEAITVAAALTDVLMDAGVDVVFSRDGTASLVKRTATAAPAQVGIISGRVTDSISREGVGGVTITVEGTRLSTMTAADGGYTIRGVPAGIRSITARRLGFVRQSRTVTVADNESVTVDFVLVGAPTTLSEVVTTATGEQRRVELGHVVGRINADSVVKEAPISTISELLTGRVAGVQVFQDQGTVGGSVRLQVRSPNSLLLESNPIVIVDGVRYSSSQIPISIGLGQATDVAFSERTSPLNDLNPNDIASIEVVKGPSAATLYGTDAANGVILITTKRGRGGPPRWNAYARTARTSIPTFRYPDAHVGYGTTPAGSVAQFCNLFWLPQGLCVRQDSIVVVPNPLNVPENTIFGSQPMWETGLSVAGGNGGLGYYFSGSYQDATGPLQMPRAAVERLEAARGEPIPDEWGNPNTRNNLNLRANVTAQLGKADLAVQVGYVRDRTQSFPGFIFNPFSSLNGFVTGRLQTPYGFAPPEESFALQSTERTDRFVGSATAQWRPLSWLRTRAAVGLDMGARNRGSLLRRGDAPTLSFRRYATGAVADERARQFTTTGDLGASATARRGRLSFRTSVGAQYVRSLTDLLGSGGSDLPPGGSSVQEAANKSVDQTYSETVTLGGYVEEMVALNDRLFLTGALRVDGASTFGGDYDAAMYPKAGLSWLASEEPFFPRIPGLDELRLRYAFGISGLQPKPEWARPTFAVSQSGWINDQPQTVLTLTALGNPDLRPERVREHEFGFDAAGLAGRAQLGLTWFQRRTFDQIVAVPLPPGYGQRLTNLGLTKQRGFEAELSAQLVDTRPFSWNVTATHSVHRTKLLDDGGTDLSRFGFFEGRSLTARFQPELTFEDVNGDGIIGRDELQYSPLAEWVYAGESEPPISQALTTVLGFLDRRVRVSALLERRAGFVQPNDVKTAMCGRFTCPALVDATTPLAEQAEALAAFELAGIGSGFRFLEPGDYIRLRELTLALDLPPALVRRFGGRSAVVNLSGRNVALWTDFGGPDVESLDEPRSVGGIPQGRTWTIRFDLGF